MSDWIDELVDWQLTREPIRWDVCRECLAWFRRAPVGVGFAECGATCMECGTVQ